MKTVEQYMLMAEDEAKKGGRLEAALIYMKLAHVAATLEGRVSEAPDIPKSPARVNTGGRDLRPYVDAAGNIKVFVEIGGHIGVSGETVTSTGDHNSPELVAGFLRDLADDVERARIDIPPHDR